MIKDTAPPDSIAHAVARRRFELEWIAFVVWLFLAAGCASLGVVKTASPVAIGTPVSVDFIRVETTSSVTGLEADQQLLNQSLLSSLRETQVFGSVSGDQADASSGLKVTAQITEIKRVSSDARVWFGGLAGRAKIQMQVTVTDLSSGKQIETFQVEGESGESARAGTTEEAIQRAAQRIAAELVKISRQTSD